MLDAHMKRTNRGQTRFSRGQVRDLFKRSLRIVRHQAFDFLCAPALQGTGHLVVVTARSVGSAPERNLIRRRLKSLFHTQKYDLEKIDWIVIAHYPAVQLSFSEIEALFAYAHKTALKRIFPENHTHN